ncbi:MAG: hypothetical protein R3F37_07285 [Candidatus Competibacteraceae bacterium]
MKMMQWYAMRTLRIWRIIGGTVLTIDHFFTVATEMRMAHLGNGSMPQ